MQNKKRWVILDRPSVEDEIFSDECKLNPVIYRILKNRGIKSKEEIKRFLSPSIEDMHDPFLLPDFKESIEVIRDALNGNKKIVIYGDYDADGVTAASILYKSFALIDKNIEYYIPDRTDEGYGLNMNAVEKIADMGVELIITVDCGTTSKEETEYCKDRGIPIVITDHHECGDVIPDTLVVNPKRRDSTYPFRGLSGAGVAFKLLQGLSRHFEFDPYEYVDLAAIGTVADIVPLVDENRAIVKYGMEKIKNKCGVGIDALVKVAGLKKEGLSSIDLSYAVSPRINAAGRIEKADMAVELFATDDANKAGELAARLNDTNKKRQQIEDVILHEADDEIVNAGYDKDSVIVAGKAGWHIGVVGIVASKLVEKYYKPVILLCDEGETSRGSARSVPGFNIYEALCKCSDCLIRFGGHEQAAGITINTGNIDSFRKAINDIAKENISTASMTECMNADCEIGPEFINTELYDNIDRLQPFGNGNPVPVFVIRSVLIEDIRTVGAKSKHLKLKIRCKNRIYDAIAFNMGYNIDNFSIGNNVDIMFEIGKNIWNGMENLQLIIRDIKNSEFKPVENEYCRSLIKFLRCYSDDDGDYGTEDGSVVLNNKSLDETMRYAASDRCNLIFVTMKDTVEQVLEYKDLFDIDYNEFKENHDKKPHIIICPVLKDIPEFVTDIYILDGFMDCSVINKSKDIKWHVYESNKKADELFLSSLIPDREDLKKVFIYLREAIKRGEHRFTFRRISSLLTYNILKIYFSIKILCELNIILAAAKNDGNINIDIIPCSKKDINDSNVIKLSKLIQLKLNKNYKFIQDLRGRDNGY